MKKYSAFILLASFFWLSSIANAVDYYFSAAGSDSNNCTSTGTACLTLSKARSFETLMNPGDTMNFRCGDTFSHTGNTYAVKLFDRDGTQASPITLTQYGTCTGSNNPLIQCNDSICKFGIILEKSDWIIIDGIDVTGVESDTQWENGIRVDESSNVIARNVNLTHGHFGVFRTINGLNNVTLEDFYIDGGGSAETIYLGNSGTYEFSGTRDQSNILIQRGEITGFNREGIEGKGNVHSSTVRQVYFHDNVASSICQSISHHHRAEPRWILERNWFHDVVCVGPLSAGNALVRYNIVDNAGSNPGPAAYYNDGIAAFENQTEITDYLAHFNTVLNAVGEAFYTGEGDVDIVYTDNVAWGNGSGNDAGDPLIVDVVNNDYNLGAGSPAIGAASDGRDRGALHAPTVANCEIGAVDSTTLVVNWNNSTFPPLSTADNTKFAVTYDAAAQTENSTVVVGDNQTRTTMAAAATGGADVDLVVSYAAVEDSALIGNQLNSRSRAQTIQCTNNVTGGAPSETLAQVAWRFYEIHRAEGAAPVAPEDTDPKFYLGARFRFRVNIAGGGVNAVARGYMLQGRLCNPSCGSWTDVGLATGATIGVQYFDDAINDYGTTTTNQLSLGGKTFQSGGLFLDSTGSIPAIAIETTDVAEWEFGLSLPSTGNAAVSGDTIELRMVHDDGTALSSYNTPIITVGTGSVLLR